MLHFGVSVLAFLCPCLSLSRNSEFLFVVGFCTLFVFSIFFFILLSPRLGRDIYKCFEVFTMTMAVIRVPRLKGG